MSDSYASPETNSKTRTLIYFAETVTIQHIGTSAAAVRWSEFTAVDIYACKTDGNTIRFWVS
jgi:hypothetical protein